MPAGYLAGEEEGRSWKKNLRPARTNEKNLSLKPPRTTQPPPASITSPPITSSALPYILLTLPHGKFCFFHPLFFCLFFCTLFSLRIDSPIAYCAVYELLASTRTSFHSRMWMKKRGAWRDKGIKWNPPWSRLGCCEKLKVCKLQLSILELFLHSIVKVLFLSV